MGQDPGAIRQEIEQTRGEMGDTLEALGHKTDVKGRAKERVSDTMDSMKSKVTGATSRVSDATPDGSEVADGARRAAGMAQQNPVGLAVGAMAVGLVAGLALPSTRRENETLGQMSDQLTDQVKETGQEALDRGKQVAQEAVESAKETVQESGREQAEELASTAQDKVQGGGQPGASQPAASPPTHQPAG